MLGGAISELSYLLSSHKGMTVDIALQYLRACRRPSRQPQPNTGFMRQLREYEANTAAREAVRTKLQAIDASLLSRDGEELEKAAAIQGNKARL